MGGFTRLILDAGKVTNSMKGKFLYAGVQHRGLGAREPHQRKRPLWTLSTSPALLAFLTPVPRAGVPIAKGIRSVLGKREKPHQTSGSTDGENTSEIKQTMHFSVRVMLANLRTTCSLLERRKTEVLVDDASAATEPK